MGYYRVRGFPLEHLDIKESEVILTLFTCEMGRIRVSVRGTKKAAASLRPALLPLTEGHYYITERRTTDLLTEWAPLRSFTDAKKQPGRTGLAGYVARFYLALTPPEEPDIELYYLLENICLLFNTRMNHDIIRVLFEWGFLRAMGTSPSIWECAACGKDFTAGAASWNIPEGGLYCAACRNNDSGGAILSLEAVNFGKKIDVVSQSLVREPIDPADRTLESKLIELETAGKSCRTEFAGAAVKFCMYHLNEDVAKWHINTNI